MNNEQQDELQSELHRLEIIGWDHCHKCNRSQGRFRFYYQEQFNAIKADDLELSCIFCGERLNTYCGRAIKTIDGVVVWAVPNKTEFKDKLAMLNKKFGCNLESNNFRYG